jgi:uncharacterized protein (TIGR02246 family)
MRIGMVAALSFALGLGIMGTPCSAQIAAADEQQIRELEQQWVAAVAKKDLAAIAGFYADDGAVMPPGAPIAEGREAISKAWSGFLGLKNFALTFAPTKVVVASGRDLAYSLGTYALSYDGDKGPVRDNGKYVVVWKKVGPAWKAVADIFNSNGAGP